MDVMRFACPRERLNELRAGDRPKSGVRFAVEVVAGPSNLSSG